MQEGEVMMLGYFRLLQYHGFGTVRIEKPQYGLSAAMQQRNFWSRCRLNPSYLKMELCFHVFLDLFHEESELCEREVDSDHP